MTRRWAVCLERNEVDSLGTLRFVDGAEICDQGDYVWVRGPTLDESLAHLLRKHPHARRHWVLPDNQLLGPGKRVPHGYLPDGPWSALRDWLTVALPVASFVGVVPSGVQVRLARTSVRARVEYHAHEYHGLESVSRGMLLKSDWTVGTSLRRATVALSCTAHRCHRCLENILWQNTALACRPVGGAIRKCRPKFCAACSSWQGKTWCCSARTTRMSGSRGVVSCARAVRRSA